MKKFSLLFVGLVMISLLITPGCKSEDPFTIVGTWMGTMIWSDGQVDSVTYTFSGTETAGTVNLVVSWANASGNYTVAGTSVTMNMTWGGGASHNCTGNIDTNANTISGSFTQNNGWTGTWSASR
jgi:hypothetical protein